jgi:hypothetical protein
VPFAATLGLFLVADFLIAAVIDASSDFAGGIIFGITFAQIVLLAVWSALGPAKLLPRTLTSFGGTILVALSIALCIARDGAGPGLQWFYIGFIVVQWFAIQTPLWLFRLLFAWRLCWPGEQIERTTQRDRQFGISHLMVWTAVVALTLGFGRWLLPEDLGVSGPSPREIVEVFVVWTLLTVYNCLLAWMVVWSTLASRFWALWLIPSCFCCIGLIFAEIFTFSAVIGPGVNTEMIWIVRLLQAGAASAALLAWRASGFRLIRSSRRTRQPPLVIVARR